MARPILARLAAPRLLEPWRSRLLWLSLAVNVFALAVIAAPHLWRRPRPGPPGIESVIERLSRELNPVDAATFRAAMTREQPWYDLGRVRQDEARRAIAATVAREPFDPVAVRISLTTLQDRLRDTSSRFDDSLVLALGGLSPQGRAELARFLGRSRR